ncbi:MAG TPA: GNAT family N-acetyltransferase [Sphingomonas sp.]|jgi:RimJ/RimL family protein N-acetyltransferase|uniref:GNAT family N-acetyltransferase n=1 Tax=Sphingomonas sp. TaxID=28214 RepID=UPI002ED9F61F
MFALTPRLTLRPGWPDDAATLARAIGHEAVVTRLAHVPWPYRVEDARTFLAQAHATDAPVFVIATRGTEPELIGGIGLHRCGDAHELGYWLTPDAWGRGYATEAGRAVVAIARDGLRLPRLIARPMASNPRSARVLAKLGFRPTGRIVPLACRALGHAVDAVETVLDLDDARTGPMPLAA